MKVLDDKNAHKFPLQVDLELFLKNSPLVTLQLKLRPESVGSTSSSLLR